MKTGVALLGARLALQEVFVIGERDCHGIRHDYRSYPCRCLLRAVMRVKREACQFVGDWHWGLWRLGDNWLNRAIEAEEDDAAYAIATILLFGAIMLFLYPALGSLLGMTDTAWLLDGFVD